jgi:hypothetical protein
MSKLPIIQSLWDRVKKNGQTTEDLSALLDDYKDVLQDVMRESDDYKSSLRRWQEEIPDLQRLIPKKFDAILKGRLQDAIGALKKKVEAVEAPPVVEEEVAPQVPGADAPVVGIGEEEEVKKPFRNMPSLGMD